MDEKSVAIFFEIHNDLPRQGPGSYNSTQKAFQFIKLPERAKILDIGCGPGKQTLDLLSLTNGYIVALDYYPVFVDVVRKKIIEAGLIDRVDVQQGDMNMLPFETESFDLIWSEGAIYIMGFENGLKKWQPFVKTGGYVAVSEITWLAPDPPREIYDYWLANYPAMNSIEDNLHIIEKLGYREIGHFILPQQDWWTDYYTHIEKRLPQFHEKYKQDVEALQVVEMEEIELEMFRKYADYYSYVFYVMQKI